MKAILGPEKYLAHVEEKKRHEEENRERERIAREKAALWLPSPPPAKFDDSENGNEDNNKGDSHGKKDGEIKNVVGEKIEGEKVAAESRLPSSVHLTTRWLHKSFPTRTNMMSQVNCPLIYFYPVHS